MRNIRIGIFAYIRTERIAPQIFGHNGTEIVLHLGGFMQTFEYTITDPLGIHARPAGMIVTEAKKFASQITISKGEKTADARRLFALMGLSAKAGDTLTVTCVGEDETAAVRALRILLETNL
jgi:phosphocarrier protein